MAGRVKRRAYEILWSKRDDDRLAQFVNLFLFSLILLNVLAVILESIEPFRVANARFFWAFECFSIAVFTVELALRLWSCVVDPRYTGALRGRFRFLRTPMALVDVFAILPFYAPFLLFDLRFLRILRLLRIFRILKLVRYSRAVKITVLVLREVKEELAVTVSAIAMLVVVVAALMYHAEHEAQPEVFSSIPAAMWWAVMTLTTIGYGDAYPVTAWGKVLTGIVAFLGVGAFALPAGIVASGFMKVLQQSRSAEKHILICPHCLEPIREEHLTREHRLTSQK